MRRSSATTKARCRRYTRCCRNDYGQPHRLRACMKLIVPALTESLYSCSYKEDICVFIENIKVTTIIFKWAYTASLPYQKGFN